MLRYLQMCVHSVVLDQVRVAEHAEVGAEADIASIEDEAGDTDLEDQALARVQGQELWDQINQRLHSEKERRVVYGSFVLALKPREIYAGAKDTFTDVGEIYRIKENVLARLRRDSELRKLLSLDA